MDVESIRIYSAPWIVPVHCDPIQDGGVVVRHGTILEIGTLLHLQHKYPKAVVVHHPGAALTPALVNGHIHLELSHLASLSQKPHSTSFTGWICQLLLLRDELGAVGDLAEHAATQAVEQQYRTGVSVLVDIGNTTIGRSLAGSFPGLMLPFKEYLGLAEHTLAKNLIRLEMEDDSALCSGHAPYSSHPRLLRRLKERAAGLGHIFPIHVAEPAAEGEMIRKGSGEMVEFIRQRGFWDDSFVPVDCSGSIHYLRNHGLLDNRTLCIHGIHVSDEEIQIMADEGAKVCLCPGSNQFLDTGMAPVRSYLDHGILPALGTDSLASNPELSIWREMRILAESHPDVAPATIFRMATQGGAEAVGLEGRFGTLEPGKDAEILIVPLSDDFNTGEQIYHFLVQGNDSIQPERIGQ